MSTTILSPIVKLSKDLAKAAKMLSKDEARFLVDSYYQLQEIRKATTNQIASIEKAAEAKPEKEREPVEVIVWLQEQTLSTETQIKKALENYASNHREGRWAMSIYGIGPVIAAGLSAHVDIRKARTAGAVWRFGGIAGDEIWQGRDKTREQIAVFRKEYSPWDAFLMTCTANNKKPFRVLQQAGITLSVPDRDMVLETVVALGGTADTTMLYEDNIVEASGLPKAHVYATLLPEVELDWKAISQVISKRPFNADLKVLFWKIGQSFLKFSGQEECYYGRLLKERWELEKQRNEQLLFKDQAVAKLQKFNIGKSTDAYKAYSIGKLPPAHILQRSCRYATKIFLAHWHHVAWESEFGQPPVKPYVFDHLPGHTGYIAPPNWPCE